MNYIFLFIFIGFLFAASTLFAGLLIYCIAALLGVKLSYFAACLAAFLLAILVNLFSN